MIILCNTLFKIWTLVRCFFFNSELNPLMFNYTLIYQLTTNKWLSNTLLHSLLLTFTFRNGDHWVQPSDLPQRCVNVHKISYLAKVGTLTQLSNLFCLFITKKSLKLLSKIIDSSHCLNFLQFILMSIIVKGTILVVINISHHPNIQVANV